jgi:hypothetical protein
MNKKQLAKLLNQNGFEILDVNKYIFVSSSLSFITADELTDLAFKLEGLLPNNYEVEYRRFNTAVIGKKVNIYKSKNFFK